MFLIIKFLLLILFFLNSCSVDSPITESTTPIIYKLSFDTLDVTDTLKIYGNNFGIKDNLSYINISNIKISSNNCIKWQNNEIWLVIPDTASTSDIFIYRNGNKSNSIKLTINNYPKFNIILVENGEFTIGSSNGSIDEQPTKKIILTRNFYISETEISQRLYRIVMKNNPSIIKSDELPVNNVSWLDAVKFCNNLSEINNLKPVYNISGDLVNWDTTANGWRLPTEAEWEYACRAGTNTDYYSNSLDNIGWYSDNSGNNLKPSKMKQPNKFGLYDMHGNLWEWCYDYYQENYYEIINQINPIGPKTGNRRVLRGGSFDQGASYARSSNRSIPEDLKGSIGIRIVRTKFD